MANNDDDRHNKMGFLRTNSVIEVNRNNNGVWHVAKILSSYYSSFNQKHKFLVQYQSLRSEFHSNDYLTECVDISFIRPLPPPPASDQSYDPLDIVDALHRGGWRKGVVTQVGVLEKNSNSKAYSVVFSNPPEKFLFCSANLRFHFDWIKGKWVSPPKLKVLLNKPQCEEQLAVANNSSKNLLEQSIPLPITSTCEKTVSPVPETEETLPNYSNEFKKENFGNHSSPKLSHVTPILMHLAEQATDSALSTFSTCDASGKLPLSGSYNLDNRSNPVANQQKAGPKKEMETSMKREGELSDQVADGEDKTNVNRTETISEGNVKYPCQPSAVNFQVESELMKNREMPFTKSSSFWQLIDSLQVFKSLPQKPHFIPLLGCYEGTREGLAIGHTLNFANLVEMASKLHIKNPTDLFHTCMGALADLELLGFDVKVVVNRINKLLSIKTRQEQFLIQSKDIHSKIEQCIAEKTEMEEEIHTIANMIKELKAQRAMSLSKKAILESESNLLQMNVNRINEDFLNAKLDFESLAASPW